MHKRTLVSLALLGSSTVWAGPIPPTAQLARVSVLLLLVLGCGVGLVGLFTLYALWRPESIRDGSSILRARPVRCFLEGVLAWAVVICLVSLLDQLPEPAKALPMVAVLLTWIYFGIAGLAMIACDVGDRFLSSTQSRFAGSAAAAALVGGGLMVAIGLFPVIGQLVQLVLLTLGLGTSLSRAIARLTTRSR